MKKLCVAIVMVLACCRLFGQLRIHATSSNTTCQTVHGRNLDGLNIGTGIINASATGGTPPYTYSISGNFTQSRTQNNGYFPQLYTADYTVIVKDANGLSADTVITISASLPIPNIYTPVPTPASSCTSNDGSIQIIVSNPGTRPYLYSIDGGSSYSTDSIFKNLAQGVYICDIKDANGCLSFSGEPFLGATNCNFFAFQQNIITACSNDADQVKINLYPTSDSALKISYDSVSFRSPNDGLWSDTISGLGGGIHKIWLKDTVTGAVVKSVVTVGFSCALYISFVSIDASCQQSDGGLVINAIGGTAPYQYTIDGINYQANNIFSGLSTGGYTITVRDASGALNSAVCTVYNKCPLVTARETDEICGDAAGTITANGTKGSIPYLFSIDGKNFQSDSIFHGLATNYYTVTIKDAKGYKDSIRIFVNNECLQVQAGHENEYCNYKDGSISLFPSGGIQPYLYSYNGGPFQGNDYLLGLSAGTYTYTVKDAKGFTASGSVTLKDTLNAPNVGLGNDTTLCAGQILRFSFSSPNTRYQWQDITTNSVFSFDSTYTISSAGEYSLLANNGDCQVRDTINVKYVNFSLGRIFGTGDTTVCIGNSIVLDAGNAGASFKWSNGSTNESIVVSLAGNYKVTVSEGGCSGSDSITCYFVKGPTVLMPNDTFFCPGKPLVLTAGGNASSYSWSNGSKTASVTITQPGEYYVTATGKGCSTIDSVSVLAKPNPKINLGNDTTLCVGHTITLNAAYANATYLWQDGSTQPLYTVSKQGNYTVDVAANGCDTTGKITVNYTTKPMINLGNDTTLCNTDKLVLDASYPQSSYLWQDGSTGPIFTVTTAGTYIVDVSNNCGSAKDSIAVRYENCACQFYVPSAFTPNGDGRNDVFKPSYKCFFTGYKMVVFDRFGKTAFVSGNADNGWDGTVGAQQQASGVYVWEISYTDTLTGKTVKKTGTVVLVR